jgi:hypothetical protein
MVKSDKSIDDQTIVDVSVLLQRIEKFFLERQLNVLVLFLINNELANECAIEIKKRLVANGSILDFCNVSDINGFKAIINC